ncbi:flagellin [Desulfurococcus amylolyticus]|uniref:Flagellin n=1 Tax=Desulfurococcus amylolyticus DSM 16532 TaxID=768672 RepID=I3XQZ7_DESAM|nr:flagellin [Desulfurococcus amylolyticus]AFL66371.1 flagellin [Desulfurococcus amylolyticus DSM 16532]
MGESTTITHALLTIVAVLMASIFAAAVIGQLNSVINTISISIKNKSDTYRMSIAIIYAYYDTSINNVTIFVKNTGDVSYSKLDNIDIFITDYSGAIDYYSSGNQARVTLTELGSPNNILEPGETLRIDISVLRSYVSPLEIRIVLVNGYSTTYVTG